MGTRAQLTVEKTVEHLETEVTGLLGLLEELASNLPPGPFSPEPDLLGSAFVETTTTTLVEELLFLETLGHCLGGLQTMLKGHEVNQVEKPGSDTQADPRAELPMWSPL
ncbi:hypothetical protein A6R68_14822 [Neotoma lepida]|uniref:Uncharacterized protein n=1 Tax=Neotoma lepida TaxID=56216 RepID=A0A1A6H9T1_NEOLE|nr:hypothetical protein A6R68_14822 [Neotoma lepida]